MQKDFVQREAGLAAGGGHGQQGAFLDRVAARRQVVDQGVEAVASHGCEETEVAEVDAEDGGQYAVGADKLDAGEQCAVAADREEKVAAVGAVAVADAAGFDAAALHGGHQGAEGCSVGGVEVAAI